MSEGVVAGRLEVPVESDTSGFGKRLAAAIKRETENIVAKIGVEWDEDALRKKLETAVDAAAKGVEAKVSVSVDTKKAKAELAALGAKVQVKAEGLADDVKRQSLLARIFSKRNPIQYPVTADRKGFFASLMAAQFQARAHMKKNPIEIPFAGPKYLRSAIMPLFYLAIASVIQPAIAAIVGSIGGALAMVGNLATSLQTLAVGGPLITGVVGGFIATRMAIKALSEEIGKTNPVLRNAREELDGLSKKLDDNKVKVAVAFWSKLKGLLEPLGKTAIPTLNKGMETFGGTSGTIAANLAKWAATPLFNGQLRRLLSTGNTLLGGFGQTLLGVAKGFMNISDAAGMVVGGKDSLVTRFNDALKGLGKWAAGLAAPGAKARAFAEDLSYAADKAGQLWRMVKDLANGIKGVFTAGRESGDSLLGSLEGVIGKWADWVSSDMGQARIKEWFDKVEPIAREAGSLIADIGKAILRMAEDPNVAAMLKKIRTDVVPALEKLLGTLGKTLGPEVIDFFTNLVTALQGLSEAGGPLATGLGHINTALEKFTDWLRANPDMAQKLGVILGGLLAFRALSFVVNASGILTLLGGLSSLLKGGGLAGLGGLGLTIAVFSGALKGLPGPMQGAAAALGTFLALRSTLPAMQGILGGLTSAFVGVRTQAGLAAGSFSASAGKFRAQGSSGFGAAAKAVGTTAASGMRGALAGLGASIGMGAATGGPIGAAIGVVSGLVGIWASKHAEASQKAQEYASFVDEIVASLDAETGALTESTRAAVIKKLQTDGAAASASKYGVDLVALTDAALGSADAQSAVSKALRASIAQTALATDNTGLFKQALKDAGVSQNELEVALHDGGDALGKVLGKLDGAAQGNSAMQGAIDKAVLAARTQTKGQRDLHNQIVTTKKGLTDAAARQAQFNKMMDNAGREVREVTSSLAKLPVGKTVTVKTLTADAEAKLKALGYKVTHMPDGTVQITATAAVKAAEAALNQTARNRTSTVTQYVNQIKSARDTRNIADGAIFKFFENGGLDGLKSKVQSFANGAEKHIAQIAPAGAWRIWAEPETGGEAYIPLAQSKRGRSMEILRQVAERFGMALAPAAGSIAKAMQSQQGSMSRFASFASGGLNTADLTPARRASVVFEKGAITVHNPVAEPAGKSISSQLRGLGAFGLFDGED